MKEFRFLQGDYPEGFTLHFTESLFTKADHRSLQAGDGWISFFILNDRSKTIEGSFYLHKKEHKATSPYRAPFGSIEFSGNVPPKVLFDFILFVDQSLKLEGIKIVTVKMPPLAYSPEVISLLHVLFVCNGFQIEVAEVGSVIHISDEEFKSNIKDSERQVLKQFHNKNFVCTQLPVDQLKEVYSFISRSQELKGYSLSMSMEELQKVVNVFKNDFYLLAVMDNQKMIAASVSIKVTDHVLYNFYLAHDIAYNKYSPVIAIIEALYNFCRRNSFSILDLGTSMLQGEPNFPLLDFKLRLGGVITEKLTLFKKLK